ncbi:YtxH domain-containing protein [Paenibacillus sp. N1-5-1-14]|uniref:YtxH domain-containing protein n=1 Tax=Paenibacillus radicibacter TaxID=2972488 RepID=UPI002158EA1B|nr:YtxH domain-containing protein [Paenibacillus radicibacter]MCR8643835.1 YtxH domain-containing protein [Paenibacillus radicibacter]
MANQRVKDWVIGSLVGGAVGAVTALLLAPKSGRELRADIADGYDTVSEKTKEIAVAVGDKTQEIARVVGDHTSEWVGVAKDVAGGIADGVRNRRALRKELQNEEATDFEVEVEVIEDQLEEEFVLIGRK